MSKGTIYGMAQGGLITLLHLYQLTFSIFFGPCCRFTPSCSSYAVLAIRRFGTMKGVWLAFKRLIKCHPFHPGGDDPVPKFLKNS